MTTIDPKNMRTLMEAVKVMEAEPEQGQPAQQEPASPRRSASGALEFEAMKGGGAIPHGKYFDKRGDEFIYCKLGGTACYLPTRTVKHTLERDSFQNTAQYQNALAVNEILKAEYGMEFSSVYSGKCFGKNESVAIVGTPEDLKVTLENGSIFTSFDGCAAREFINNIKKRASIMKNFKRVEGAADPTYGKPKVAVTGDTFNISDHETVDLKTLTDDNVKDVIKNWPKYHNDLGLYFGGATADALIAAIVDIQYMRMASGRSGKYAGGASYYITVDHSKLPDAAETAANYKTSVLVHNFHLGFSKRKDGGAAITIKDTFDPVTPESAFAKVDPALKDKYDRFFGRGKYAKDHPFRA